MGRKRKPGTEWLPDRVYMGRSSYEYKPASGGTYRLCPLSASKQTVWRHFTEKQKELESNSETFQRLVDEFISSPAFTERAASTQKKYKQNANQLLSVFGKMKADAIKPEHVRKYMDLRGKDHKVAANREKAFMQAVFSWAYERGKVKSNPCKGVKKFTETSREKYITDKEYTAMYECGDSVIKAVMEISYCCAARVSDVLSLRHEQLLPEGIEIKQGKTGTLQIKEWTNRLRRAIKTASEGHAFSVLGKKGRVITNERGNPVTYDSFRHRWVNAKEAVKKNHPDMKLDFTFHDIKAKSISDWEGDKKEFSGHKSESMIKTYDRKTKIVGTHE